MDGIARLILMLLLLWALPASAQTTITIPQDPAIAGLTTQFADLTAHVRVLSTPAVPMLSQFKALMIDNTANTPTQQGTYGGGYWCAQYASYAHPAKLFVSGLTYYDAARVYYQIADYTHEQKWNACAKTALIAYREGYVNAQPVHGKVAGWEIFPKGLYLDWIKTGDAASKQAVLDLAANAAFSEVPSTSWVPGPMTIREMSYNLEAKLYANDLGAKLDYSFHLTQLRLYWRQMRFMLEHQTWVGMPAPDPLMPGDKYVRPFMVGISAEALIEYDTRTHDATILPLMKPVLELMWQQAYDGHGAMRYTVPQSQGACPWTLDDSDSCVPESAPLLNMLIAPAYMWVYQQTGETVWRDRADTLFAGVVAYADRTGTLCCPAGKAYNQIMRWMPEYFRWRQ